MPGDQTTGPGSTRELLVHLGHSVRLTCCLAVGMQDIDLTEVLWMTNTSALVLFSVLLAVGQVLFKVRRTDHQRTNTRNDDSYALQKHSHVGCRSAVRCIDSPVGLDTVTRTIEQGLSLGGTRYHHRPACRHDFLW